MASPLPPKPASSGIIYRPVSNPDAKPSIHVDLVDYIDLLYHLMGVDITYKDWHEMSDSDKLSFARDLKIKKIIE